MRKLLPVLLLLSGSPAIAAQYNPRCPDFSCSEFTGKGELNVQFFRNLAQRIEAAGYKNAEIVSQMVVVIANGTEGKKTMLIVDSTTLKAFEVDGAMEFISRAKRSRPYTE